MGNLASLDLSARGGEAKLRALLEDVLQYYAGVYTQDPQLPQHPLALGVWFEKSPGRPEQNLLALFLGTRRKEITVTPRQSMAWRTGIEEPPYLEVHASSVEHFTDELRAKPADLDRYRTRAEVLYFDKKLLSDEILKFFNIVTTPSGLIRGWYLDQEAFSRSLKGEISLHSRMQGRPELGIIKTEESPDFAYAKGLLHMEISQRWVPLSPGALVPYTWYSDWRSNRPGYFLFEGGSLYQILRYEVKTAPEYQSRFHLVEKLPDDRYAEVYLRAVSPSERAAT